MTASWCFTDTTARDIHPILQVDWMPPSIKSSENTTNGDLMTIREIMETAISVKIKEKKEISAMPNIIQLSETPIPQEDRLTPGFFDIEDQFLREVAEYVQEESNPEETIRAFQRELLTGNPCAEPFHEQEERGVWFRAGFQEAYFRKAHTAFVRLAGKLARETTLDGFIRDKPKGDLFTLREAYNERYGWYVYYDTMTMTLDDFMRHHAKTGKRYYYGSSVYYHT